jgi:hypothetical protein
MDSTGTDKKKKMYLVCIYTAVFVVKKYN